MATQRPTRPPTFTWESDRDWTGQPFTAEDTHDSERQLAPDRRRRESTMARPRRRPPRRTGRRRSGTTSPRTSATPRIRDSRAPGSCGTRRRTPPVAVVLAEDVFAGLLDDPPPGASWTAGGGPFDDEPTDSSPRSTTPTAPAVNDVDAPATSRSPSRPRWRPRSAASALQAAPADVTGAGPGPTEVIPAEAAPTEVVDAGARRRGVGVDRPGRVRAVGCGRGAGVWRGRCGPGSCTSRRGWAARTRSPRSRPGSWPICGR